MSWSLLVTLCLACGGPGDRAPAVTVRDSAGVEIVENGKDQLSRLQSWSLTDEPRMEIGVPAGAVVDELHHVAGAVRLHSGNIVIANAGTYELRLYDASGVFIRSAGGEGGAPGEFRDLAWVRRYRDDSLVVYDRQLLRLSIFAGNGQYGRSVTVQSSAEIGVLTAITSTADGSFIVAGYRRRGTMGSRYRLDRVVYRYAANGNLAKELGAFPGREMYRGLGSYDFGRLPFGRDTYFEALGHHIVVATSDRFEIKILTPEGTLKRIIRAPFEPTFVTERDREFDRGRRRQAYQSRRQNPLSITRLSRLDDLQYPNTFPAFSEVRTDTDGNLWVADYRAPGDENEPYLAHAGARTVSQHWWIFGPSGMLIGEITFPSDVQFYEAGTDYAVVGRRDILDVEYVSVYGLVKGDNDVRTQRTRLRQ